MIPGFVAGPDPKGLAAAREVALPLCRVMDSAHATERAAHLVSWLRPERRMWTAAMECVIRPCPTRGRRICDDVTVGELAAALRDALLAWIEASTHLTGDAAYEELASYGVPAWVMER